MKKTIAVTAAGILLAFTITANNANAGAARRHTIEGFMIGAGAAILGAAIINEINNDPAPQYKRQPKHHASPGWNNRRYHAGIAPHHQRFNKSHQKRGHWEMERIWIPPEYETRWNPGHYNRRGKWVDGRHEKFIVSEGYYKERRVWISHRK